jgi:hypothetical protein
VGVQHRERKPNINQILHSVNVDICSTPGLPRTMNNEQGEQRGLNNGSQKQRCDPLCDKAVHG